MYICIYIYLYTHANTHINRLYTRVLWCMHVLACIRQCVCVCVCVYTCVCEWDCVSVYMCLCFSVVVFTQQLKSRVCVWSILSGFCFDYHPTLYRPGSLMTFMSLRISRLKANRSDGLENISMVAAAPASSAAAAA